jgi:hypothetical protein
MKGSTAGVQVYMNKGTTDASPWLAAKLRRQHGMRHSGLNTTTHSRDILVSIDCHTFRTSDTRKRMPAAKGAGDCSATCSSRLANAATRLMLTSTFMAYTCRTEVSNGIARPLSRQTVMSTATASVAKCGAQPYLEDQGDKHWRLVGTADIWRQQHSVQCPA